MKRPDWLRCLVAGTLSLVVLWVAAPVASAQGDDKAALKRRQWAGRKRNLTKQALRLLSSAQEMHSNLARPIFSPAHPPQTPAEKRQVVAHDAAMAKIMLRKADGYFRAARALKYELRIAEAVGDSAYNRRVLRAAIDNLLFEANTAQASGFSFRRAAIEGSRGTPPAFYQYWDKANAAHAKGSRHVNRWIKAGRQDRSIQQNAKQRYLATFAEYLD